MQRQLFNSSSLAQAVEILRNGGVIAHAADTCFGLAADFSNPEAVKRVQAIKGRDAQKPMSLMLPLAGKAQIERYARLDDLTRRAVETLLPGPVTLLLPKGPDVPDDYYPETGIIGLRIPDDALTQALLTAFGGPLITTSANPSGQSVCKTADEVGAAFENAPAKPDLIFEGKISGSGLASTVIAFENGTFKIVRPGPLAEAQIRLILGSSQ